MTKDFQKLERVPKKTKYVLNKQPVRIDFILCYIKWIHRWDEW